MNTPFSGKSQAGTTQSASGGALGSAARPDQPPSNLASSSEVQAWIATMEAQNRSVSRRNKVLLGAMLAGLLAMIAVLWVLYQTGVRSYAVLQDVAIARSPANQGRLQISFQVVSPGRVFYRRTSGQVRTEVVDYFDRPGEVKRDWSWVYEPGKDIDVSLTYRGGLWRRSEARSFPTARQADIVILIDTTGSMSRSIHLLKEKCVGFSKQLKKQSLEHRFALIGFGDTSEDAWVDKYDFTDDVEQFQKHVAGLKRFDGGDLPESAIDALDIALALPFAPQAIRRFYLVTDAPFHEPTKSGAKAEDIAKRLDKDHVLLYVFSRPEFATEYTRLVGESGKFQEIEDFGAVLSEGRILDD